MNTKKVTVWMAAGVLAGGLAWSQQTIEERRTASPNARVEVENIAGSVTIVGWDRDELEITGTLGRGTKELDISGDAESWSIEVDISNGRNVEGSDLIIHLPRGSRIEVETVSADIEVSEVEGRVDLETVSGRVEVLGDPREADVNTVSGTIRVATRNPLQGGDFETVSGEIVLEADLSPDGRFDFETVSGDIVLNLSGRISADFEIESFSGNIDTDFGVEPNKPSRWLPSEELHFSLGGGGAEVSASTVSGNIRLRKR